MRSSNFPTHLLGPRPREIASRIRAFCAHASEYYVPLVKEFVRGTSVSCGNIERRSSSGGFQLLDKTRRDTGWSMINGTS